VALVAGIALPVRVLR